MNEYEFNVHFVLVGYWNGREGIPVERCEMKSPVMMWSKAGVASGL